MGYRRLPVDPAEGVECLVCHKWWRSLVGHVPVHGLTPSAYRERFPGARLTGSLNDDIHRDQTNDMLADGRLTRPKLKMCRRGLHKLWGRNVKLRANGKRTCRACERETNRKWREGNETRRAYMKAYSAAYYRAHSEKWTAKRRAS